MSKPGYCGRCGGELDVQGWCANYCMDSDPPLQHIRATTCPYGTLNQHLRDEANCDLGEECVYSPRLSKTIREVQDDTERLAKSARKKLSRI